MADRRRGGEEQLWNRRAWFDAALPGEAQPEARRGASTRRSVLAPARLAAGTRAARSGSNGSGTPSCDVEGNVCWFCKQPGDGTVPRGLAVLHSTASDKPIRFHEACLGYSNTGKSSSSLTEGTMGKELVQESPAGRHGGRLHLQLHPGFTAGLCTSACCAAAAAVRLLAC